MADDELTGDEQASVGEQNQRDHIKRLEKDLAKEREQNAANSTAARELAFLKAGVDTDHPGASYFVQGYQGELTREAIRAEAERAGFLRTQQQAPEPPQQPTGTSGATAIGHPGADEAAIAAQGFQAMQAATVDPQISGGVNHVEGMRKAAEEGYKTGGAKGASDALVRYMQAHDLPVAESAYADVPNV